MKLEDYMKGSKYPKIDFGMNNTINFNCDCHKMKVSCPHLPIKKKEKDCIYIKEEENGYTIEMPMINKKWVFQTYGDVLNFLRQR